MCELEKSARYGVTKVITVYWDDGDVSTIRSSDSYLREWEMEALYNCNLHRQTGDSRWYAAAVAKIQWGVDTKIEKIEVK
jgi:hypothetical protein